MSRIAARLVNRGRGAGAVVARVRAAAPRAPGRVLRGRPERGDGLRLGGIAVPGSALVPREGAGAGVPGGITELGLDPEQLVVLGDPLGPGRGTGLDLATVRGDGQVGDGGVLGLAGAV